FLILCLVSRPPAWLYKALGLFAVVLVVWAVLMVVLARVSHGGRFAHIWEALKAGIGAFRTRRTWVVALLIAPLPWLWEAFILTQAGQGFGIDLTLVQAFSVMIAFNLATIVPSPGSMGTVEVGGTAALLFFGVDQSRALAFMFVYHFSQLLPGIAGGAAVLVAQGEKLVGTESP